MTIVARLEALAAVGDREQGVGHLVRAAGKVRAEVSAAPRTPGGEPLPSVASAATLAGAGVTAPECGGMFAGDLIAAG